jgi:hypothetical protein
MSAQMPSLPRELESAFDRFMSEVRQYIKDEVARQVSQAQKSESQPQGELKITITPQDLKSEKKDPVSPMPYKNNSLAFSKALLKNIANRQKEQMIVS